MDFHKPALLAISVSLGLVPAAMSHSLPIAKQTAPVPVTTTDLGSGIYMLQGRGGNVGVLVGGDGVFVIDAQYADMTPGLLQAITDIGGDKPRFLLNTHWHGDHTGGNAGMTEAGATIIAHQGVRDRVSRDITREFFGQQNTTPAAPPEAWPVITFGDSMTLHLNGQTIHLIHLPEAHTDGDTFVWFEEANIIHTGDVLFNGMYPFVDITSGGTFDGYIAGLERILSLSDENTQIIPGHGGLAARADVESTIAMLNEVVAALAVELDAGKSLEDTIAAAPLSDWSETWGNGFMNEGRFTTLIYQDLVRKRAEAD